MKCSSIVAGIFLLSVACGKSDPITTTRVRPPVQKNLPSNLLAAGSFTLNETDYSKTCQTDPAAGDACSAYSDGKKLRCIVKNRLFCAGPTEVLRLLDGVDGRLKEIETRSAEGEVKCASGDAVDLSSQLSFPGEKTLPSKFKCKDSTIGLGFGDDAAGTWHIREANGAAGQAFEIKSDTTVHGYMWLPSKDGSMSQSTGLLEISANPTTKTTELTGGGVGFGFCGLHFQSSAEFVYLTMNPDGVGASCDFNQDGTTDSDDWVEACFDATTLDDVDADKCTSLKTFSLSTLGRDKSKGTGAISEWEAVAPLASGTVAKFELATYLLELYTKAGSFEGVSEFKAESSGVGK